MSYDLFLSVDELDRTDCESHDESVSGAVLRGGDMLRIGGSQ